MRTIRDMRALVVDDSSAVRSLLRVILQARGFRVVEAENGRAALQLLERDGAMNLALIDWNMPELGGLHVLNAIRSDPAYDAMRVMMVTTQTDLERVKTALGVGANEYVMKPFNQEMIYEKLSLMGF